jgi:hypothetical protein
MRNSSTKYGFSTIELLIALMIMTTTLTATTLITLELPSAVFDGNKEMEAGNQALRLLNNTFTRGLTSFDSITSLATTTTNGIQSSLSVQVLPDGFTKLLFATVSWIDSHQRTRFLVLRGIATDFAHAAHTTCSNVLGGDWSVPRRTFVSFPFFPIQSVTVDSASGANLLAAATQASVQKTDPVLSIFDISSSTAPVRLGSLDNASSTKSGYAALAMHDHSIYAANDHASDFDTCVTGPTCSQLQIIDATNPAAPVLAESFQLATATEPYAGGLGGQSAAKSIFYQDGLAYLGLQKTPSGDEFNIINVRDIRHPQWLGGFSIGRTINHVEVRNSIAYLATDDPTHELLILDVHDPQHIFEVTSFDAPGYSTYGFGEALSVQGNMIALGRSYTTSGPELLFFNDTASSSLTVTASTSINGLFGTPSIQGLLTKSYLLFALLNSGLQIWNVTNPYNPAPYGAQIPLPLGNTVSGTSAMACKGNTVYVASSDNLHTGYLVMLTGL